MKSGLEDRNNNKLVPDRGVTHHVSMKSGLEDRNNIASRLGLVATLNVSMKSGLEDRNNANQEQRAKAFAIVSQ